MIASFIGLQFQTGTPQMFRYAGTNVAAVGSSFGTADIAVTSSLSNNCMPCGRVIRFGGLNTYVATVDTNIYRSTNGGSTWTAVHALTDIASTATQIKSGFAVVYLNGLPALAMMYQGSGAGSLNSYYGVYSFDGVTWTTQGSFTITTAGNLSNVNRGFNHTVVQGSTVYIQAGSSSAAGGSSSDYTFIYQPGANSITAANPSGIGNGNMSPTICEFNNRIFVLYVRTAATTLTLGEIVGNNSTVISSLQTGMPSTTSGTGTLFVDGVNMYAIATGSDGAGSNTGFKVWQISSTLTVTEITSTVLPTILRSAYPLTAGIAEGRVQAIIDGVTSPGSAPTIYLYFSFSANTNYALYQWNGNATEITLISQGGTTLHSLPFFGNVTGTYFVADSVYPSTTGISVEVTNRIFTATGVRLSFKIYGTSAGGAVSFRVYVGAANEEYPTTAGTLTDPSVGAISGGNINTGLTADNGVTTYQVTWAAQTDGFTTNSQFRLVGDAFV